MAWIKFEHVTPDKPEVFRMAEVLRIDRDAVVGKLLRVWIWCDQQMISGKDARLSDFAIDEMARCKKFAAAMREVGWLGVDGDATVIPNFERHNGETAKARAMGNRRVSSLRSLRGADFVTPESAKCNGATVTPSVTRPLQKALPEREREKEKKDSKEHSRSSTVIAGASPGGSACLAMRQAGLQSVNPSHPKLIALLQSGATNEELADVAREAKERGKGFAYALAMLEGRRRDAANASTGPPGRRRTKHDERSETLHGLTGGLAGKSGDGNGNGNTIEGTAQRVD